MWSRLLCGLLVGLLAASCADPTVDEPVEAVLPFDVGEPLTDPAVVASVVHQAGADTLTSEQFNRNLIRLNSMFPDVMSDPSQEAQIRREIVKQFVVERLLMAEAQRHGMDIDSSDVTHRLNEYRASFASEKDFEAELARFNQDETDLRDQFRVELIRNAISELVEDSIPAPSAAEVDSFRKALAERVLTQHILFMVDEGMSPAERRKVAERARAVLDSARGGRNFGELAGRHSDDVGTAQVGGELPWFRRGEMVEEFEKAALALESPGSVTSNLVETTYGYHIIRLVDRIKDQPIPADSAKSILWRHQVRKAERDLLGSLQAQAEVRVNPDFVPGLAN